MRWMKWLGYAAGLLLIGTCFMTWVIIASKGITVSGVSTEGTLFGKPGYFHLIFASLFLILHSIQRIWAKRFNLPVVALNMAWAIRNYFLVSSCRGGDCPEKQIGLYLMLAASVLLLVAALFPDIKIGQDK